MELLPLAFAAVAVVAGATLQRVSGFGVGLVVAPTLSVVMGPGVGVLLTNMTTVVSGLVIMVAVWRHIDWRRFFLIGPMTLIGALAGAWLVGQLATGWLSIILGTLVGIALIFAVGLPRLPLAQGPLPALTSGVIGGFFNTTSGVAGPVFAVYSRLSRWDQRAFAATMQPLFITMGLASIITKLTMGSLDDHFDDAAAGSFLGLSDSWLDAAASVGISGEVADLGLVFLGIVVMVMLGALLGSRLSRVLAALTARRIAMTVAGLGAAAAVVRGILELQG